MKLANAFGVKFKLRHYLIVNASAGSCEEAARIGLMK
jgi:hypothetical protein